MITWMKRVYAGNQGSTILYYGEGDCISTDTKPTEQVANGSKLLEMDTGDVYAFDMDNTTWHKL